MSLIVNISKTFEFCYGHRVHTQTTSPCKCQNLHGHNGEITVSLEGSVKEDGMVVDFTQLSFVKDFIKDWIDHKMLMDEKDPMLERLIICDQGDLEKKIDLKNDLFLVETFCLSSDMSLCRYKNMEDNFTDFRRGLVLTSFVPTSEMLCQFFACYIKEYFEDKGESLSVTVSFSETVNTSATISLD